MSNAIFWRLVWKEYRLQRAFWIAMAALTVMVQLLVMWHVRNEADEVVGLFAVALGIPAFYALGCGATLFATEHEAGTYGFQRALPVTPRRLFSSKILFAMVSVAALIALMWFLAVVFAGWRFPDAQNHLDLWGVWGMAAAEGLVWGVFFSLLLRRPLMAAVLAGMTAACFVHLATLTMTLHYDGRFYVKALPLRAIIVALVAAADVWLGQRWFRESILSSANIEQSDAALDADVAPTVSWSVPASGLTVLGRLVWQQWRQSARLIAALSAAVVLLLLAAGSALLVARNDWTDLSTLSAVLGMALAPVIGSCVFLADQHRGSFRFLADRGIRPSYVWLSRHLVWIPVVAVGTAVTATTIGSIQRDTVLAGAIVGYALLAYTGGQLASMFVRSSILAAACSVVLMVPLCFWAILMQKAHISWAWSVAPIPLILMVATWLRAADWLRERNGLRARLRAGLSLLIPLAAIVTAVCFYRAYEIPYVEVDISVEEFGRPRTEEEQATLAMYRRALARFVSKEREPPVEEDEPEHVNIGIPAGVTEREIDWVEANTQTLEIALAASERTECNLFDRTDRYSGEFERVRHLGRLLVVSARKLTAEGKLDEAWRHYLAALRISAHLRHRSRTSAWADVVETAVYHYLPVWAGHPEQTPQRMTSAMAQIREVTENLPSRTEGVKYEYYFARRMLEADAATLDALGYWQRFWLAVMPWERARAVRLVNYLAKHDLQEVEGWERAMANNTSLARLGTVAWPPVGHWWATTPWMEGFELGFACAWQRSGHAKMLAWRRMTRVVLALEAWKAEHGELPESLDVLLGEYLERLPTDPFSGERVLYFPKGFSKPITAKGSGAWAGAAAWDRLEAGTPLLWIPGPNVNYLDTKTEFLSRYRITIEGYSGEPRSEEELRQAGWAFPIP